MRILIFTSKNHPYANLLLKELLQSDIFHGDTILIGEQSAIVPGKSSLKGLQYYSHTAGIGYVFAQACKTYLFLIMRCIHGIANKRSSPFFPYWKGQNIQKVHLNDLKNDRAQQVIQEFQPELILSLLSKEIIPKNILDLPKHGSWNLHPALLPNYKGVSPTFWVLAENQKSSGCTLHVLDEGIDTGTIIAQHTFPIEDHIHTEHALYMTCIYSGIQMVSSALQELKKSGKVHTTPQEGEGCYRSIPTKEALASFKKNGYRLFTIQQFVFPKNNG